MFDDSRVRTACDSDAPGDPGLTAGIPTGSAPARLAELRSSVEQAVAVDVDTLTDVELLAAVASAHGSVQLIDGFLVRCADRARRLEAAGTGPPAEEALTGGGAGRALDARDHVRASEVAESFPLLGAAVRAGRARPTSFLAVVRLWRRLDDEERARFVAAFDDDLARRISAMPPDAFTALVQRRGRSIRSDDGAADAEAGRSANELRRRRLADGRYRYVLELDPLTDEAVWSRVESRAWADLSGHADLDGRRTLDGQLRARALADLVLADRGSGRPSVSRPHHLSIIVDHHTLREGRPHAGTVCETERGTPVPLGLLHRYACDAEIESYVLDGSGRPFDHGRTRRTATARQRRALRIHYGACPLSGTPLVDCEIHHLDFWEDEGPTDYDNLVPLSRRWHHLIHDQGWSLRRSDDGGLVVHRPDGAHHRTVPPPIPLTRLHAA